MMKSGSPKGGAGALLQSWARGPFGRRWERREAFFGSAQALRQVSLYTGRILKGENQAICRVGNRLKSRWSSILKPLRRSALPSHFRYLAAPSNSASASTIW